MDEYSVNKFKENILKDYNRQKRIQETFCQVETVSETDGSFTQIAIRPLLDKRIFEKNSSFAKLLVGAAHSIVIGEMRHFIDVINNNVTKELDIEFSELGNLPDLILQEHIHNGVLLVSPNINYHLAIKRMTSYDYSENEAREYLEGSMNTIVSFNKESLTDSIIVYSRNNATCVFLEEDENNVFFDIKKHTRTQKIDATIKTMLKIIVTPHKVLKINIKNVPKKK